MNENSTKFPIFHLQNYAMYENTAEDVYLMLIFVQF